METRLEHSRRVSCVCALCWPPRRITCVSRLVQDFVKNIALPPRMRHGGRDAGDQRRGRRRVGHSTTIEVPTIGGSTIEGLAGEASPTGETSAAASESAPPAPVSATLLPESAPPAPESGTLAPEAASLAPESPQPAPDSSLVVVVASTREERTRLLAQFDPSAPVLVLPSVAAAQQWLSAQDADRGQQPAQGAERAQQAAHGAPRQPPTDPGMRLHQDRQALGFGSVEVTLTALEFALLRLLIREPGRVWRFDELVHHVWGTDHVGDTSQVHALVKRLRAKLARERAPMAIEAVRGVGFRAVRPRLRPPH